MARNYSETRMYPMNITYVLDCIRSLVEANVGYTVWYGREVGNGIETGLNHTITMSSYGEEIIVGVFPAGNQVQVSIYSKNAWPLQLADMGRNKKNADEIFDAIQTGRYLNHPNFLRSKQEDAMAEAQQRQGYVMPPQQGYGMPPQGQPMPPQQGYNMPPQQGYSMPQQGQAMPPQQGYNNPPYQGG